MVPNFPVRRFKVPGSSNAEDPELYRAGGLHPVHIGDHLKEGRYRIVHKLGFGGFSTVWLARDILQQCYVSLKICKADFQAKSNEIDILRILAERDYKHEGRQYVMMLKDHFEISGPNGSHRCLVAQVAGNRLVRPPGVNHLCLGPSRLLISQAFLALDYLHSCNVGHGDLYTGNILFQLDSFDSWSDEQLYRCMGRPVKEKVIRLNDQLDANSAPCYTVHSGNLSRLGQSMQLHKILLVDFGGAYFLDDPPLKTTTPSQYSAPEVLRSLGVCVGSDVWALGCATFEICAGYTLFKALFNPRQDVMKDIVAMLGKPSDKIWDAWDERSDYFNDDASPLKRTERSILVESYPLRDRLRDMAWLYPADGKEVDLGQRMGNDLQTMELVQMHNFLSKIFLYEPTSRVSVRDALAHPFLALMNFSSLE